MNLSETEQTIFNLLKRKKTVSLDELMKIMNGTRHSLTVRMKYLGAKVAQDGWIITNEGGVGRGAKAVYSMTKRF